MGEEMKHNYINLPMDMKTTIPFSATDAAGIDQNLSIIDIKPKHSKLVYIEIGNDRKSLTFIPKKQLSRRMPISVTFDNETISVFHVGVDG